MERDIGNKISSQMIRAVLFLEIGETDRQWPYVITGFAEYGRPTFNKNRRAVDPRTILGMVLQCTGGSE